VSEILIFDAPVIVFNKITILMIHMLTFNVAQGAINPVTANCQIYPAQQEYCVRQLPDISGDICLDHIGTWRQEYFVSGVYNF